MARRFMRLLSADENGQDLVEYALLGATVALASLVVFNTFGGVMQTAYQSWDAGTQSIWEPRDPQAAP